MSDQHPDYPHIADMERATWGQTFTAPPEPAPAATPVTEFTADDMAELRRLREERTTRAARDAADAAEAAARLSPPSHHVHLADGQVVEGSQLGTHHTYGDGTGSPRGDRMVAVVGCYPL
jgi:hypothetical protein